MKINKNSVVELTYTLTVDGSVADQATAERPLDFIFGIGSLLPKFEEYILDKEAGDSFAFTLSPAEGYGEYDEQAIIELPKNIFEVDGKIQEGLLTVGNLVPMMNQQGGIIPGKVHEVKEDVVLMDFNHQMAGKTLNFEGSILTVREATEEELRDGLHGEFKESSCGCGCSGCGEGDCGDGSCGCEGGCC